MAYQHILIATDLTDENQKVADKAKMLAEQAKTEYSIVHIVEFNPMLYGGGEFAIPLDGDIEESVHQQAEQSLREEGKRLGLNEEHQYLLSGNTIEQLSEVVKNTQTDLLVMGHRHHRGLMLLLGSTAGSVLHHMPCDVLAVSV